MSLMTDGDAVAAAAAIAATSSSAEHSLKRKRSSPGVATSHEQQQHQSLGQAVNQADDGSSRPYPGHGRASAPSQQHSRHGHLQINYLVRQFSNDIPVVSYDDTCPNIISLLNEYNGVFDRHESIASNLGAPSTGAEWVRRFERMFDAPPRIVSHPPGSQPNVTWLDVVSLASAYPDHFTLSPEDHVPRVCELRIKDCDVLISEHDFEAIKSGGLRNMIPSQPVAEDEEKELGALQILEKSINEVVHFADQVALRGRVFARRLGERKAAIVERRSDHLNGDLGAADTDPNTDPTSTQFAAPNPAVVSQATHDELLRIFGDVAAQRMQSNTRKPPRAQFTGEVDPTRSNNIPAPLLNHFETAPFYTAVPRRVHRRSEPDGPYRAEINARTDPLQRGERIYPPCDRCRRLRIDCLKNLTACAGCTKKHAKCSWREVKADELSGSPPPLSLGAEEQTTPGADTSRVSSQVSAFRHEQQPQQPPQQHPSRHDDVYHTNPQQEQGPNHHHNHHHHQPPGYEPAFDPAFDEVDERAIHQAASIDPQLDEARAAAREHARVQEAARSLAMAAIESQTANLAAAAAAAAAAAGTSSAGNGLEGSSGEGDDPSRP